MTRDASPEVRRCVERIAAAETDEQVKVGFDLLDATLAQETADRDAAEREHRRATGKVALAEPDAAQQAADYFNALRAESISARGGE